MATEIVVTNMVKINGFSNARYLIDIAQETVQIQVVADSVFVAFEMSHVNRIKAYRSSISDIRLRSTGRPSDSGAVRESAPASAVNNFLPLHHTLAGCGAARFINAALS